MATITQNLCKREPRLQISQKKHSNQFLQHLSPHPSTKRPPSLLFQLPNRRSFHPSLPVLVHSILVVQSSSNPNTIMPPRLAYQSAHKSFVPPAQARPKHRYEILECDHRSIAPSQAHYRAHHHHHPSKSHDRMHKQVVDFCPEVRPAAAPKVVAAKPMILPAPVVKAPLPVDGNSLLVAEKKANTTPPAKVAPTPTMAASTSVQDKSKKVPNNLVLAQRMSLVSLEDDGHKKDHHRRESWTRVLLHHLHLPHHHHHHGSASQKNLSTVGAGAA